ncbi:MAG: autotransporter-associated beta strand repeat-containing protein, partial [Verrucomicrobiales bacterium]|nr:autotransporter-associated beta strand repeat-containing protein [Verrucomicrobiales bacterium]
MKSRKLLCCLRAPRFPVFRSARLRGDRPAAVPLRARPGVSGALALAVGVFGVSLPANAPAYVWDGGGTDDNFGTADNWNPSGAPTTGSGVTLEFGGTVRLTPNNNYTAFDDFGNLIFVSGAGAFTLGGNAIDLFGKIENNSSNLQTINLSQIAFQSASAQLNPVNADLVINSTDIFTNGNTINVWGNNGHTLTINGVISDAGGLTINQNSNVVLTAANTYTGTTTITAGSLSVGAGGTTGALGTTSITNNASLILNRSDDFTFANAISGSGSLTKLGGGIATLTGSNSFSGKTLISAGTLSIDADSRLGAAPGSYVADQLTLNG